MNPLSIDSIYGDKTSDGSQGNRGADKNEEEVFDKIIPPGRSFIDILAQNNDPEDAVECLKDIYSQLKDQSIFLTGFQFVAISLTEDDTLQEAISIKELIFFMLTLGFFLNLLAAMMTFTSCEYLTELQGEDPKFIKAGLLTYGNNMRIAEALLFFGQRTFLGV